MAITSSQFKRSYQEILDFICAGVPVFGDDDPVKKRERIARAKTDKLYFAKEYFPHYCEDEFSPMHSEMFRLASVTGIGVLMYGYRGSAKSSIVSLIDVVHKICYRTRRFIGFISASEDNAAEYTIPIKAELEANPRIINDFGELRGTSKWRDTDFVTKNGVRVLGIGPKMSPKGRKNVQFRFDHIIIEDIESRTSPNSARVVKKIVNFLLKDAYKATNPKLFSFIFLGNYFSKKSILHKLLNHNDCKHWVKKGFAALVDDGKGSLVSSWPGRFPTKQLLDDLEKMPETERVEMMQKPEDEDAYFNPDWFQYYEEDEIPPNLPVVTYVDPAALKGMEHCYKAIIVLAVDAKNMHYYIRHAWLKKTSKWQMVRSHFNLSEEYKSSVDGIEANGFQSTLKEDYEIEENVRNKTLNIKLITNLQSKEVRIGALSSVIERGKIKFKRNHSDQNLLVDQFIDFPDGDKDGPDAVAGAKGVADRFLLKIKHKVKSKLLGAA